ncbi:MAG: 16S rRNA (adenine1518-N6/adenine1519-N6)-dimethyltransferase [Planctomycetota bacterium]|jgi:16S rRNA (adenine1518-N6/adenine1519-N6)-dimethyltransferase
MHQARKRFGQHFLHDSTVIDRILRAVNPAENDKLLEIGPGQGALTYPLLKLCKSMTAVELDRDLIAGLQAGSKRFGDLHLINSDVLKFDLATLPGDDRYRLVGNLPYNISTPLMFHLLNSVERIEDMIFMVQKEVGLRIVAPHGTGHYGRLSIMLQYHCKCDYLFEVGPESFSPPPKVDSAIIRLTPHRQPQYDIGDYELFSLLVQTAFGQRRKTISNSLKTMASREILEACAIDPGLRAENLTLGNFSQLSNYLSKHAHG